MGSDVRVSVLYVGVADEARRKPAIDRAMQVDDGKMLLELEECRKGLNGLKAKRFAGVEEQGPVHDSKAKLNSPSSRTMPRPIEQLEQHIEVRDRRWLKKHTW